MLACYRACEIFFGVDIGPGLCPWFRGDRERTAKRHLLLPTAPRSEHPPFKKHHNRITRSVTPPSGSSPAYLKKYNLICWLGLLYNPRPQKASLSRLCVLNKLGSWPARREKSSLQFTKPTRIGFGDPLWSLFMDLLVGSSSSQLRVDIVWQGFSGIAKQNATVSVGDLFWNVAPSHHEDTSWTRCRWTPY